MTCADAHGPPSRASRMPSTHREAAAGRRRRGKPVFACTLAGRRSSAIGRQGSETGLSRRSRSAGLCLGRWQKGCAETYLSHLRRPCSFRRHPGVGGPRRRRPWSAADECHLSCSEVGSRQVADVEPYGLRVLGVAGPPGGVLVGAGRQLLADDAGDLGEGHFDVFASVLLEMAGQAFVLLPGDHAASVQANSALVTSGRSCRRSGPAPRPHARPASGRRPARRRAAPPLILTRTTRQMIVRHRFHHGKPHSGGRWNGPPPLPEHPLQRRTLPTASARPTVHNSCGIVRSRPGIEQADSPLKLQVVIA